MAKKRAVQVAPKPVLTAVREGYYSGGSARSLVNDVYLSADPNYVNTLSLYRYRVTVEQIEEPPEVLAARLVELWETTSSNHHHTAVFQNFASKLGVVLDDARRGCRVKAR